MGGSVSPDAESLQVLTAGQLAPLRREAADHVVAARRAGRRDEAWETALTALDRALDATVRVIDGVPRPRSQP